MSGAMKTQTRRIVKPQPVGRARPESLSQCPYGVQDDRLWVRETWAECEAPLLAGHYQYAADGAVGRTMGDSGGERLFLKSGHTFGFSDHKLLGRWVNKPSRWQPSIFMPRRASRITLEVTGVRVERLQGITEADARAEGISRVNGLDLPASMGGVPEPTWSFPGADGFWGTPAAAFRFLWQSINGGESWAENPWVWVVSFKRLDNPGPLPEGVRERPILFSAPMVRAILGDT